MSKTTWYVAETLPRKEIMAVMNLARQSFESFCPSFRKTRKHARKQESVLAPLFPGYIFVQFDPDNQPWRSINGTWGVRRLIGSENIRPQPMPQSAMDAILARCRNGIMMQLFESFEPGRIVLITSGPFADRLATIASCDGPARVKVLLDILGGEHALTLAPDCLAPQ